MCRSFVELLAEETVWLHAATLFSNPVKDENVFNLNDQPVSLHKLHLHRDFKHYHTPCVSYITALNANNSSVAPWWPCISYWPSSQCSDKHSCNNIFESCVHPCSPQKSKVSEKYMYLPKLNCVYLCTGSVCMKCLGFHDINVTGLDYLRLEHSVNEEKKDDFCLTKFDYTPFWKQNQNS